MAYKQKFLSHILQAKKFKFKAMADVVPYSKHPHIGDDVSTYDLWGERVHKHSVHSNGQLKMVRVLQLVRPGIKLGL